MAVPSGPKAEPFRETDSVLNYPDSHLVESGNRHLSTEEDFRNLTIVTNEHDSNASLPPDSNVIKDPWDAPELSEYFENTWESKTVKEKWILRLIAGRTAGNLISSNAAVQNPISGIMIGLFFTVVVQSSSTATSVVVSMVAAGFFKVRDAIPFVMGANIGTSITNSIVAFTQVKDRAQFQRAFAGATIHDLFNLLTTVVLIILEVTTHYLERFTDLIVKGSVPNKDANVELLGRITKPLVSLVLMIDKKTSECFLGGPGDKDCVRYENSTTMIDTGKTHIFKKTTLTDQQVGIMMFVICILIISVALILSVKILRSVLKGRIAKIVKKIVNTKIPYCPCLTGYVAILIGASMTFISQSSSVFTSALTPLVGMGVLSIEIMYPLTLGANVGTTGTAILAAFAVDTTTGGSSKFQPSLQIALCHLFFNLTGILVFYPLPFMRWPIYFAKKLGKSAAHYRWTAILYLLVTFLLLPGLLLGLSFVSDYAVIAVVAVIILLVAFVGVVNFMQETRPKKLPKALATWNWLPLPLRSFEPYDKLLLKCKCCCRTPDATNTEKLSSRQTSQVTVHAKSVSVLPQPSNISLNSFVIGEQAGLGDHDPQRPKTK
ncbi:unnamed protein product [Allacma fusca]|uniref:Uncharacterized protein n=1 Tax=Allacma fusca TaxID=39272 RepID=A0A8J2Q6J3_9HEXA|nr:unnamed protein product [Allacma fusca]